MGVELSSETIARLKARASDPSQRTGTSALATGSIDATDLLGAERNAYQSKSPEFQREMREYLEGMNSPFAGMISNSVAGDGSQAAGLLGALGNLLGGKQMFTMMGDEVVSMGGKREPTAPPPPPTAQALADAEAAIGFELPGELRQFYAAVADGGVGPGDGVYSLAELVAKWREMTDQPIGPRGQKWPKALLPIHGDRWDVTCIDRDTGKLIHFDAEEIGYGGWSKSFKPDSDSLEAWLRAWLG